MIYTIGDSHCDYTFQNIPNVSINRIGPITLKRISHPDEHLLQYTINSLPISSSDTTIFCFGEIDARCWIHVYLTQRKRELNELLNEWTDLYINKLLSLTLKSQIAVLSITPPSPFVRIYQSTDFPVNGSDQERSFYTQTFNNILKTKSQDHNILFIDVYSEFKDQYGMLPLSHADQQGIHIFSPQKVSSILNGVIK